MGESPACRKAGPAYCQSASWDGLQEDDGKLGRTRVCQGDTWQTHQVLVVLPLPSKGDRHTERPPVVLLNPVLTDVGVPLGCTTGEE